MPNFLTTAELDAMEGQAPSKLLTTADLDALENEGRSFGQVASDAMAQGAKGVNTILGAVPNLIAPDSAAAQLFNENAAYWEAAQSDITRAKAAAADARIQEAAKNGFWGAFLTGVKEYGSDPVLVQKLIVENLPSMLPGIGAAKAAQVATTASKIAKGVGAAESATAGLKAGTMAAATTNAALNAGGARQGAFADWKQILMAQGWDEQTATEEALRRSWLAAGVGAAAGAVSGSTGLERMALGAAGKGGAKGFAKELTKELAGEQLEELSPQAATNLQIQEVQPERDWTQGLGQTAAQTLVASAPGGVLSGAGGLREETAQPSPMPKPVATAAQPTIPMGPQPAAPSLAETVSQVLDAPSLDAAIAAAQDVVATPDAFKGRLSAIAPAFGEDLQAALRADLRVGNAGTEQLLADFARAQDANVPLAEREAALAKIESLIHAIIAEDTTPPPSANLPDLGGTFERSLDTIRQDAEAVKEERRKAFEAGQVRDESLLPAALFDAERQDRIAKAAGQAAPAPTAMAQAMDLTNRPGEFLTRLAKIASPALREQIVAELARREPAAPPPQEAALLGTPLSQLDDARLAAIGQTRGKAARIARAELARRNPKATAAIPQGESVDAAPTPPAAGAARPAPQQPSPGIPDRAVLAPERPAAVGGALAGPAADEPAAPPRADRQPPRPGTPPAVNPATLPDYGATITEGALRSALSSATRTSRIPGMVGDVVPDPIAQDLLRRQGSLRQIAARLAELGINGLRPLAGGASSVVLDAGERVVRLGFGDVVSRPNIPEVLQADATGAVGGVRYEVLPKVDTAGIGDTDVATMDKALRARGYAFSDPGSDNLGRLNGNLVVTDPGSITKSATAETPTGEGKQRPRPAQQAQKAAVAPASPSALTLVTRQTSDGKTVRIAQEDYDRRLGLIPLRDEAGRTTRNEDGNVAVVPRDRLADAVPPGLAKMRAIKAKREAEKAAVATPTAQSEAQAKRVAEEKSKFELAKERSETAIANSKSAAAVLEAFPKGRMGLTPDDVKASPEWKAAKAAFDRAFAEERAANKALLDAFPKEIRAERDATRAARVAAMADEQTPAAVATTEESSAVAPVSEMDRLKDEMGQAIGELASLLGAKSNLTPEEETALLPVMSKIFRIAAQMGYQTFADAGRYVYQQIKTLAGDVVASKLDIGNLHAGFINTVRDTSPDPKAAKLAALAFDSIDELMATAPQTTTEGDRNAVQKPGAARPDVRQAPANREAMGSGDTEEQAITETRQGPSQKTGAALSAGTVTAPKATSANQGSLLHFMKAKGGLAADEALDLGGDKAHILNRRLPGLFRKQGLSADAAREVLQQHGWLAGVSDDEQLVRTRELISDALRGNAPVRQETEAVALLEAEAEAAAREHFAAATADAAEERAAIMAEAEFVGEEIPLDELQTLIDTAWDNEGAINDTLPDWLAETEVRRRPEETEPAGTADRAAAPRGEETEGEGFDLAGQTLAEVEAQEAARQAAAGQEEPLSKAQIDREAAGFTLTGEAQANPRQAPTGGQGGLFTPDGRATQAASNATSDASLARSRERHEVRFAQPYAAKNGNALVGYLWPNKKEEYIDRRGEDRVRTVSDWEQAVENLDTGRQIVHQFAVRLADGTEREVSAETAAKLLGIAESTVRSSAKRLLEKEIARAKRDQEEQRLADAIDALPAAETPAAAVEQRVTNYSAFASVIERLATNGPRWASMENRIEREAAGLEKYRFLVRDGRYVWSPELAREGSELARRDWANVELRAQEIWPKSESPKPAPADQSGDTTERGGEAPQDTALVTKPAKIADMGEKIGGAKKDLWATYNTRMRDAQGLDVTTEPLSKSWPVPDYQALLDAGADPWAVGFMRAARDAVPAKPRVVYKVKRWAEQVRTLRDTASQLADGSLSVARAKELLREMAIQSRSMSDLQGRIELYQLVGHEKSLDGVRISYGEYSIYEGVEYKPAKIIWSVEKETAATAFSNWPRMLATGATKAEALANFKAKYDTMEITPPVAKEVTFDLYVQGNQYYVGKKLGRNILQLAGPFTSLKEARAYRTENQDALAERLAKAKEIPKTRRDTNEPRVGEDMRNGQDVTPELFMESFGFKGVEFGNWVEQKKRQQDLNNAFDALMDMAAILDVPPKALSLNGELGLAFGARGSGGVEPAAAHYERDKIVINLTKKEGAGSLGHEWFHAVDNYFSRLRAKGGDMATEALDVSLADRGSDFVANTALRREMVQAFGEVMRTIRLTALKARASKLDAKRSKDYWTTKPEMAARAFESYLIAKLQDHNASNDYLANIVDEATWKAAESLGFELDDSYPYPTAGEIPAIRAAFDKLFATIETEETERGVLLREESAVYTVHEPDGISGDLFQGTSDALPNPQGKPVPRTRQAARRDVPAQAAAGHVLAVRQAPDIPGLYHVRTQLVTVGERALPVARVTSWQEAAQAFAHLTRYAVEHLDALVTDQDGKPLAVIGAFKGAPTQASVYPGTVMMELARIDGAAHLWISHNHPSGADTLSRADEVLSKAFADRLRGSGVEYHGLSAMARRGDRIRWQNTEYDSGEVATNQPTTYRVPIVEREIVESTPGQEIGSPAEAKRIVRDLAKDQPGVVFFTAQNAVAAFVPFEPAEMGALRQDGRLLRLFSAASQAGATASIVAMPDGRVLNSEFANLKGALESIDVRVLDGIEYQSDGSGQAVSLAEQGKDNSAGIAFLRRGQDYLPTAVPATAAQAVVDRITEAYPGAPAIRLVDGFDQLPVEVRRDAATQDAGTGIRGTLDRDGVIWVVRQNNRDAADVEATVFHELLGHVGIRKLLGQDFIRDLNRLYFSLGGVDGLIRIAEQRGFGGQLASYLEGVGQAHTKDPERFTRRIAQSILTEEVFAHLAEQQPKLLDRAKALLGQLRAWLRDHGFLKLAEYGETDLLHLLRQADAGLRAPGGRGATTGLAAFSRGESTTHAQDLQFAAEALNELSFEDAAFRYPVSTATTIEGNLLDALPDAEYLGEDTRPDEREESQADRRFVFAAPSGKVFYVYTRGNEVWIDVSRLQPGDQGSAIYHGVANYAHNTGKVFVGDPNGLSEDAVIRRTAAMLSSALRFGTTAHIEPAREQLVGAPEKGIEPLVWKAGDDLANVKALIHTYLETLHQKFPAIKDYRYDFANHRFVDRRGRPLDADRLERGARGSDARASRSGEASLRRGILLQSLASSTSSERPGILEQILRRSAQLVSDEGGLKAVFARAYHGSPYRFDKFSTENIGTGEGAQAFGHGLYFASRKEVADHYKSVLGGWDFGYTTDAAKQKLEKATNFADGAWSGLREALTSANGDPQRAAESLQTIWADGARDPNLRAAYTLMADMLRAGELVPERKGALYEVELSPDQDEYLLWDKPLSEQPAKVRAVIDTLKNTEAWAALVEAQLGGPVMAQATGRDLYKILAKHQKGDEAASKYLHSLGVRGVKYLDGDSRRRPLRDLKREFLAELPEDADFDEVTELLGTGTFSPANEAIIKALQADDWLGFDYPAQALSAALSGKLSDFDASPALVQSVADAQEGGTYNYVVFDDRDVAITSVFRRGEAPVTPTGRGLTGQLRQAVGDLFGSETEAMRPRAAGSVWDTPTPSKMDDALYSLQDKQIDTKRVIEAVKEASGGIADEWNPYLQEELFHGRSAKGVKDFLDLELRPLLQEMQARKVAMSDFEEYLWNRHAEERNAQIAKINEAMPDGGSGIATADARAYLANLTPQQQATYERLAKRIDAINAKTRQLLIDSGLEKTETIAAWEGAYQHYVPLQREDMDTGGIGTGQGFSIRGSASKRAVGSGKPVADILGNIAMQREKTIVRAEKNRVSNALFGLVKQQPNPEFWSADEAPTERVVATIGGEDQVVERVVPGFRQQDNVLLTRINGEDHYVVFNEREPRALRMALAMKNLDADQLGRVLSAAGRATRYLAAINTQYNPIFGIVNLIRDVQSSLLNLSTTPIKGEQKKVLGYTVDALRGIYADMRAHRKGQVPSSKWAQLWEEFQKEGGQTGYRDQYANAEARAEAIAKEIASVDRNFAVKTGGAIFDWLSDYNETMENAVRLAAYRAAKESGQSNSQAASIAKNISVNFNRKGVVATQVGALYAFFNASTQGTARLAETLRGPMGKRIIYGGLLLGAMQATLLAAAGMGDDEPPEFVRERNLILPIGDGKYLSLPMPLGFHVLPNIGRIPVEFVLSGFKQPSRRVADFLGVFADTFNPIGNAGLSLQTIAPTVVDPLAALAENRDWTGKPIAKTDMNALAPTPGHLRAKDTATTWSKAISYGLNLLSGGTDYQPGLVSPTPDQIDYLLGQATGGVGRELSKLEQAATAAISGEEMPLYKVPLMGKFVGDTAGQSAEGGKFYAALKRLNGHEAELKGLRKEGKGAEAMAYLRGNPEAKLVPFANAIELQVQRLRRAKREAVEAGNSGRVRAIEQQITAKMAQLNARVRSMEERAG